MISKLIYWSKVIIIGTTLGVSLQFVRAWTEPTVTAPGGNVGAPITPLSNGQTKSGSLGINGSGNALLVPNGSVGIGTTNPGSRLSVNGGLSIGTYYSTGAPSGGLIVSGNLGVGKSNPAQKLDVSGSANISGNMGIGKTNPGQKLDVSGNINATGQVIANEFLVGGASGSKIFNSASTVRTSSYGFYTNTGKAYINEISGVGTVTGGQFCLAGVCKTAWPTGLSYVGSCTTGTSSGNSNTSCSCSGGAKYMAMIGYRGKTNWGDNVGCWVSNQGQGNVTGYATYGGTVTGTCTFACLSIK